MCLVRPHLRQLTGRTAWRSTMVLCTRGIRTPRNAVQCRAHPRGALSRHLGFSSTIRFQRSNASLRSSDASPEDTKPEEATRQTTRERLASYGLSGVASYGLFNTLYYVTAFLCILFTIPKPEAIDSLSVALQHVLKLLALVWAGSQVTKLPRAACALACAPFMDKLLEWIRSTLRLKSKRQSFFFVLVPFCWLLFFALITVSVLFLRL